MDSEWVSFDLLCVGSFFCSFLKFLGTFQLWYFWLSLELSFCLSLRVAT